MRTEVHFEAGGFWALKPEWNDLVRRSSSDTLFLTWEWQSTWWKHLGEGSLLLLGFRHGDDGRLAGIAPLFRKDAEGRSVLNMIGCRDVSDYLDDGWINVFDVDIANNSWTYIVDDSNCQLFGAYTWDAPELDDIVTG